MAIRKFSTIDWAGLGESWQNLSSKRSLNGDISNDDGADLVDIYDFPSMAEPRNSINTQHGSGRNERNSRINLKKEKRDSYHEDIMEDGQRIKVAGSGDEEDRGARRKRSPWCIVMTLMIAIAAAVVCYVTLPLDTPINLDWNAMTGNFLAGTIVDQQLEERGQSLFELAQNITMACGKSSFLRDRRSNLAIGMSCEEMCQDHMCCVEEDEEYSCVNDESMDCPSYAGCIVLSR